MDSPGLAEERRLVLALVAFGILLLTTLGVLAVRRLPAILQGALNGASDTKLESCEAYQSAVRISQHSEELQRRLGSPIKAVGAPRGRARTTRLSGFAEWSVDVAGSLDKGKLNGAANRTGEDWEISRLVFEREGAIKPGEVVDLTPTPSKIASLPPAAGRVFLVPLGLSPDVSLAWVPPLVKAKLGVNVELLPNVSLDAAVEDPNRHQAIAEELTKQMLSANPETSGDPANVFLGVTDRPMFIQSFSWTRSTAFREYGRYGIISTYEIGTPADFANPELINSRLLKMLLKNIAVLALRLPLSGDANSLLSWPVTSGFDVDRMTEQITPSGNEFVSSDSDDEPCVSVSMVSGFLPDWRSECISGARDELEVPVDEVDLALGLVTLFVNDFRSNGELPFNVVRASRPQDKYSRAFGIGANDSFDIYLIGDMKTFTELIGEEGGRVHFRRDSRSPTQQIYLAENSSTNVWGGARLSYEGDTWHLKRRDGWIFLFPYRPQYGGPKVTVLTGMIDPQGKRVEMIRDGRGDLMQVSMPSGRRLSFSHDIMGRIILITDSENRTMRYEYDASGRLIHAWDSNGKQQIFGYDERDQMLTISDAPGHILLSNLYSPEGDLIAQEFGRNSVLTYNYRRNSKSKIESVVFHRDDHFSSTFDVKNDSYTESLPAPIPSSSQAPVTKGANPSRH